jgi:hypothetical protein
MKLSLFAQEDVNDIKIILAGHWWLTPVILAIQEAKIRRIGVQSQPQAKSL